MSRPLCSVTWNNALEYGIHACNSLSTKRTLPTTCQALPRCTLPFLGAKFPPPISLVALCLLQLGLTLVMDILLCRSSLALNFILVVVSTRKSCTLCTLSLYALTIQFGNIAFPRRGLHTFVYDTRESCILCTSSLYALTIQFGIYSLSKKGSSYFWLW